MSIDFKTIHIGGLIKLRVLEKDIDIERICNFLKFSATDVHKMYECKSLDTDILMRWSKLLEYDFFRLYTQHLILFAPQGKVGYNESKQKKSILPRFRKNIYTKEVINFILEIIQTGEKTKQQVIEEYNIPKTTLYKWIEKYTQLPKDKDDEQ